MNKFKLSKLSDLVDRVKVGFVGPINEFYCDEKEGIPLIRTTDISDLGIDYSNLKYVTKEFHEKNRKSQIKNGDLIIARHGENGKANIFKESFEAQVLNAVIIEPNNKKLDSNLLKIFFDSPFVKRQILGVVKGSVQGVINTAHVANLLLPISEEIDYLKLTKLIGDLDSKISLNNRINVELEAMAKTLYDYWFVQFDFPNAKGKPYKTSGGRMVWSEELKREIPEGWEVKKLQELGEFKNGVNYDPSNPGEVACPIINVRNISASSYFLKNEDLDIIYLRESDVRKYAVHNGSIIIARSGIPGATRLIADIAENTLYCGFAIHYELNCLELKIRIFFYLKSIEQEIQNGSGGTILKNVNQATLNSLRITLPKDIKVISSFNDLIQPIFSKLNLIQKENQKLTELRDWLLPMLMNGQIRIKDAEQESSFAIGTEDKLAMAAEPETNYRKKK